MRRTRITPGAALLLISVQASAQPEPPPDPAAPGEETTPAEPSEPPDAPEAVPAPLPPPVPPPAPAASAPAPAAEPAVTDRLAVGTEGFFRPGILLQAWFLLDRAEETTSTFRIRRAELHARGEILPGLISYAVMIDPAKVLEFQDRTLAVADQDPAPTDPDNPENVTARQPVSAVSVFQDFFITLQTDYLDLSIGQFKIPVSWEGYNSSSKLLFPERALVARELGDKRDLGLRLAKTFRWFGFSAGVFNGAALNNLDGNNAKDLGLRLEAYPIEGIVLAGVAYASAGNRESNVKDRYEADLRFERGPFLVQAEYVRAHDVSSSGTEVEAQGFYGALAWTFFDRIQPCVRLGLLDPDVDQDLDPSASSGRDEVWQLDVGLNYYVRKHEAKLQLAYSRFQFDDRRATNEAILAAQVSF
ncbi:MAG: hypothetical protein HYY06_33540 [Deltaproteobacteria bacterium]|nr:hypothetical protein [Deltaproteobacteria bacterium]